MANPFKFLYSSQPSYMIFWVTRGCNFSCAHCFNHGWNGKNTNDLTLSEINSISLNMDHLKYLTLAGGEPMLRDDLSDIAKTFYRNNDIHVLNVVTNGWFPEKVLAFAGDILETCPGLHLSIGVSVDGPETVHDRIRCKPGSYKKALNTITSLKKLKATSRKAEKNLTVAACGTYSAENAHHLSALADNFQNIVNVPYYAGLIRGDSVRDNRLKQIDIDHYAAMIDDVNYILNRDLAKNYPFRRIRIAVDQVVSEMMVASYKHNRQTVNCMAGKKGMVLTADGDVLLCEVLNKSMGSVRYADYSIYDILRSKRAADEMVSIRKTGCHCTWECFLRLNTVFSPELYPRVLWKILRSFLS